MARMVTTQIEDELIELARKALDFGDTVPVVAIVRRALILAIGDDAMPHVKKRGRPFASRRI